MDKAVITSSYALGVSKVYTLFKLIFPMCKFDIVSAITLAGGFAIGAAAPVILTAAVIFAPVPGVHILSSYGFALPSLYINWRRHILGKGLWNGISPHADFACYKYYISYS